MSSSGVNYFLNNYADFNYTGYWSLYFDFKSTGLVSASKSGASTGYSGVYSASESPVYDYRYLSNTGASYINILPSSGLWSDTFTLIALNQKTDSNRAILFNCFSSGLINTDNVYKGFIWSYSDGSKPTFYYYGLNGPETFVADFSVDSNHSAYLIKDGNDITLGKYDFLTQTTTNNSFSINSDYLFEPTGYSIGNNKYNTFPSQLSGNGKQKIDEFIWFRWPLSPYDIRLINSGWAADYVASYTGSGNILTTGITGYVSGTTGITGITGWGVTGTGFLTDPYGINYTGYLTGHLTGTIFESGITGLTGLVNTPVYSIVPEGVQINSGFLRQFYKNYVTFLRDTDTLDFDSIYYETGYLDSPNYLQSAAYDDIQEKFKVFQAEQIISWANGVAQFSGTRTNSGTIYNPNWVLDRDYFRTGSYLDSNGFYDDEDNFWYNDMSGVVYYHKDFVAFTGNSITLSTPTSNNTLLFLNGQRIYSGINWSGSNIISFAYTTKITGDLSVIQLYGQRKDETGNFAWRSGENYFNPNYTMLFMNGQQQIINQDFLVSDLASMLSGSGIFDINSSLLLNNTNVNDPFFT